MRDFLDKNGFEMHPNATLAVLKIGDEKEWPLTVTFYTSRDKEGEGRCGSCVEGTYARRIK